MDHSSLWPCQSSPSEIRNSGNFRSFWPWLLVIYCFFVSFFGFCLTMTLTSSPFSDVLWTSRWFVFLFQTETATQYSSLRLIRLTTRFGWRIEAEKIRMYLPETNSKNAWKWMVGRLSRLPLGIGIFSGGLLLLVSGSTYRFIYWRKDYTPHGTVLFLLTHEKPVHLRRST